MVATELLKLAMETEEGRKERLKKMVANHSAEAKLYICRCVFFFSFFLIIIINK